MIERRVEPIFYMPYHADGDNFYEKYISTYVKAVEMSILTSMGELNPNLDRYREID